MKGKLKEIDLNPEEKKENLEFIFSEYEKKHGNLRKFYTSVMGIPDEKSHFKDLQSFMETFNTHIKDI